MPENNLNTSLERLDQRIEALETSPPLPAGTNGQFLKSTGGTNVQWDSIFYSATSTSNAQSLSAANPGRVYYVTV